MSDSTYLSAWCCVNREPVHFILLTIKEFKSFLFLALLLQIVLEILGDALVKMYALMAPHVVGLAGIDEEIGLRAGLDAFGQEREAMLGHHGGVVVAGDNLELALQVFGLAEQ